MAVQLFPIEMRLQFQRRRIWQNKMLRPRLQRRLQGQKRDCRECLRSCSIHKRERSFNVNILTTFTLTHRFGMTMTSNWCGLATNCMVQLSMMIFSNLILGYSAATWKVRGKVLNTYVMTIQWIQSVMHKAP